MACTNPCLLYVLDTRRFTIFRRKTYEEHGWKFSKDLNKGYYFCTNKSQHLPLEKIDAWQSQDIIEIPCGSCLDCRIDYSKDWAVRCEFESKLWKNNYFITLTYNDENLVYGSCGNPTLVKEHIDQFIKALRNYFSHRGHKGIRYFLCGEYNSSGDRLLNPHYHLLLFNCPLNDLTIDFPCESGSGVIHKMNKFSGMPYFYSPLISSIWNKGYICIDEVHSNAGSYVSGYIMKKQKGESSSVYNDGLGVIPPFLRMSNRPGIGYNMFLKDFDKYVDDPVVILSTIKKPVQRGLPKYFKRKLFEAVPSLRPRFEADAKRRELNARSLRFFNQTTSNEQKYFRQKRRETQNQIFDRNNT